MTKPLKIDFVSDVSCPWCLIGLGGLEEALKRASDAIEADIHFQPFELNPDMAPEGENIAAHVTRKFGSTYDDASPQRKAIQDRAAQFGVRMTSNKDSRIYNTFDAHRLLHWAGLEGEGRQAALKHALFEAYFADGRNVGDADVLVALAETAGLDGAAAREVLTSGRYASEVRAAERRWREAGINSVPAIIINDKYLISGGQPPEAFEKALRGIAAEAA